MLLRNCRINTYGSLWSIRPFRTSPGHLAYNELLTTTEKGCVPMPSIVGNVKIVSVGPSSIVNFGDSVFLSPTSSSKTFAGAGSFNTGDLANANTLNAASSTNTNDPDVVDSPSTKVGPG